MRTTLFPIDYISWSTFLANEPVEIVPKYPSVTLFWNDQWTHIEI